MAGSDPKDFFKQQPEAPAIKAEVLPPFFKSWVEARQAEETISVDKPLLYLDLQAVPSSTPEVAATASHKLLKNLFISAGSRYDANKAVQPVFLDGSKAGLQQLQEQVEALPFYEDLHHKPVFLHSPETIGWVKEQLSQGTPAFVATDPFGHKLAQDLWHLALEQGQSDFLLLFEYKRLASAFKTAKEGSALATLLGDRLPKIREFFLRAGHASKKEKFALEQFKESLLDREFQTSTFKINAPGKDQTQFYLLLVSKNELAHTRFKEQLLPYCEYQEDGVALFGANQKAIKVLVPEYYQYLPFSQMKLTQDLAQKAALFHSMTLEKIYQKHNVGTPYSRENYLTAFEKLKEEGKITLLNPKTGQVVYKLAFTCRIKFKKE
ncbi:hypothetical protein TH63_11785 [Rufibacter radiotolerans]|uniref:GMT-like wHTH domain-containing protein n=1 Tax=Rufibacter radiotolerans TaxID=1379910 RepID=A0A0H4VQZ9_9BACT|nr:hypothetical protein [Rufibacter radiotolerans]AKQ46159.1 hypothetical protein TH63_11785 [Rufibacter radiotolerans]